MLLLAVLIALPIAFLIGGDDDDDTPGSTSLPPTTAPVTAVIDYPLYFLADHVQNSNKPGPHLMPIRRSVEIPADASIIDEVRTAVLALIGGPLPEDGTTGLSTSIPEGTELLGLVVDQTTEVGTVTVDFNRAFASGSGTFSVSSRIAQVVFTVTAFDGIDEVVFSIDGAEVEVLDGVLVVLGSAPDAMSTTNDGLEIVRSTIS